MHSEMLYDLCDLLSEATEEVVGQVRKTGNKMTASQLDQPDRRPPNAYGPGNGSNLVNELERVMAQETNQRKLEMYQQMLDLAHKV